MNQQLQIKASGLVAASGQTADLNFENISGGHFAIDITAVAGTTPTVTITIEAIDPVSGKYYTILASAALSALTTTVLKIYPGLVAAANLVANDVLPKAFRVRWTIGGSASPSVTFSIGASLLA